MYGRTLLRKTIENVSSVNYHSIYKVAIPEQITLEQLYCWLVFDFVPLPNDIETLIHHLPIFDRRELRRFSSEAESIEFRRLLKEALASGKLVGEGKAGGLVRKIPREFWELDVIELSPIDNKAFISATTRFSFALQEEVSGEQEKINSFEKQNNGISSFHEITFDTAAVIQYFKGKSLEKMRFGDIQNSVSRSLQTQWNDRLGNGEPLNENKVTFKLEYDRFNNCILLNGHHKLTQQRNDSDYQKIILYLLDHPNRKISKKELEEKALNGAHLPSEITDIVNKLGFTKFLRSLFFETGNKKDPYILLHNPVSSEHTIETLKKQYVM